MDSGAPISPQDAFVPASRCLAQDCSIMSEPCAPALMSSARGTGVSGRAARFSARRAEVSGASVSVRRHVMGLLGSVACDRCRGQALPNLPKYVEITEEALLAAAVVQGKSLAPHLPSICFTLASLHFRSSKAGGCENAAGVRRGAGNAPLGPALTPGAPLEAIAAKGRTALACAAVARDMSSGGGRPGVGTIWDPILVGEFTTHFRTYFSGDWDVHWGYGILTHGQLRLHDFSRRGRCAEVANDVESTRLLLDGGALMEAGTFPLRKLGFEGGSVGSGA